MARRKVVLLIVEGPSDETALDFLFQYFYDPSKVYVRALHKDITSETGNTNANIVKKVCEEIKNFMRTYPVKKSDFLEIIHVVDTDGAFVDNSKIITDTSAIKVNYTSTEIRTSNREAIILRNAQKSRNLNILYGTQQIWKIPYRIFYMSCNLDHVLHNKQNSSDTDKTNNAYVIVRRYKQCPNKYITFLSQSKFSVMGDYKESWEYIKKDLHSLERHTNIGICFI